MESPKQETSKVLEINCDSWSFDNNPTTLVSVSDQFDWCNLMSSPSMGLVSNSTSYDQLVSLENESILANNNDNCGSKIIRAYSSDHEDNVVQKRKGMMNCVNIRSKKTKIVPRFAFETRSAEDILDDGFRWRKYGQKSVKNSNFPRSYYRCTHVTCNVKKQVQRLTKDRSVVVTTYEGVHNHPSEKLMEALSPLLTQMHFLSSFTLHSSN